MNDLNFKLAEPRQRNLDLLNTEQYDYYNAILEWLKDPNSQVALLEGKPGVGKTFLLQYIISAYKARTIFTAPTNKATKVLQKTLSSENYIPDTCTIYSLLGLSMSDAGEVKELKADKEDIDIGRFSLVVLDEAYMVGTILKEYIDKALKQQPHVKLLLLGDSFQLNPVGEYKSPIENWFIDGKNPRWLLTKVERHSGDILTVVDQVREAVTKPLKFKLPFLDDFLNKFEGSVTVCTQEKLIDLIEKDIASTNFENSKAIAWRNVTVDFLNTKIRSKLYPETHKDNFYEIGDVVTLTQPAKDFIEDKVIATTDDMGIIEAIDYVAHPSVSGFDCARLRVLIDNSQPTILYAIAPYDKVRWTQLLNNAFREAKMKVMTWKNYWELYSQVHYLRHAYAITAHRSQGSTYDTVFVNLQDIMRNQNRVESLRCLLVAMSRAKSRLIIGR